MACYHPWRHPSYWHELPCGQCIGCRLERSRQWAIRCTHEAQLHELNCFVTFTYEIAPPSLRHRDWQLFMKKLRRHFKGVDIRYYMCGEYGETLGRPHFHACLFGIDFLDKTPWRKNAAGDQLYRSATLERLWRHGNSEIGAVTFQSAAYVARYVMAKQTGDAAASHYTLVTPDGEIITKKPEYNRMSLRPAIGKRWLERYKTDVYPSDQVIARGYPSQPPRYYDKQLTEAELHAIKKTRAKKLLPFRKDNTPRRRAVKEQVKQAQLQHLKRNLT